MIFSGKFLSSLHVTVVALTLAPPRSSDPKLRKRYVELVEAVQRKGGEVLVFSSMHESGQREFIPPKPAQTPVLNFS